MLMIKIESKSLEVQWRLPRIAPAPLSPKCEREETGQVERRSTRFGRNVDRVFMHDQPRYCVTPHRTALEIGNLKHKSWVVATGGG